MSVWFLAAVAAIGGAARGGEFDWTGSAPRPLEAGPAEFRYRQPATESASPGEVKSEVPAARPRFGAAGSKWWTIGAGVADNFQDAVDTDIAVTYSYFLAKDVEFGLEGALWYFNQPGDNPVGGSASVLFRWHFIDTGPWTVYADAGIGLLLATDDVPPGGTSFDFMPRAGMGFTRQLTEEGLRLQVGVQWHHISNARLTSDEDNPGRDAAMIYAGLIFPF